MTKLRVAQGLSIVWLRGIQNEVKLWLIPKSFSQNSYSCLMMLVIFPLMKGHEVLGLHVHVALAKDAEEEK